MNKVEISLILSCSLIIYTYLVYPAIVIFFSLLLHRRPIKNIEAIYSPRVAILCAMYNEETVVIEKIKNYKALEYSNIHFYIGSDGSSDKTNELLSFFKDDISISIYSFPRRGKVYVINDLISLARADIFVFTDANSMFKPNTIQKLISDFRDPSVGAVCGHLELIDNLGGSGESLYWRFENILKRAEGVFKSVIGCNGAIYAVRSELTDQLPPNTINDDFLMSMRVFQQGYGIAYADDAIAIENVGKKDSIEFRRHIRDGAGHYRAIAPLLKLMNPFFLKRFFFYVSHRVIRWFVPHLMLLILIIPWFDIESKFCRFILLTQAIFYTFSMVGFLTGTKNILVYIPYYFTYINIALMFGFIKNIMGKQKTSWESTQRD
jgi:cellulose synthase/poly-beta-1,6-N-acetylglucosamine synthase-like glycosyltransferase